MDAMHKMQTKKTPGLSFFCAVRQWVQSQMVTQMAPKSENMTKGRISQPAPGNALEIQIEAKPKKAALQNAIGNIKTGEIRKASAVIKTGRLLTANNLTIDTPENTSARIKA